MKEFLFRLSRGRAQLLEGDGVPAERVRFCLENKKEGTLVLADEAFPFSGNGIILSANDLKSGIYTPVFFVDGKRYEGPAVSIGAGCILCLPPTHARIYRVEDELDALTDALQKLTQRLCKIEALLQDTTVF